MSKSIPKFVASETELGHHCLDPGFTDPAAEACDALTEAHHELSAGDKNSDFASCYEFDSDGFRCYADHLHFEMSTPQVESAADFVLVQRLLRKKLLVYKKRAEELVGPMRVYFNNTNRDSKNGKSWGHHLNVLVSREAFERWAKNDWNSEQMRAHWVPWLVTSLVITGSGKVGAENGAARAPFQLGQRCDWVDRYSCLETVDHKSLLNERDEPHSFHDRYARLHVIAFDSPRAEFATFLRVGMVQCILAALESELPLPDLELKDPLVTLAQVSRDLSFKIPLALANGRTATALELQYRMAEAIEDAILAGTSVSQVPHAALVTKLWITCLDDISKQSPSLISRLDWRARMEFIRKARDRERSRGEKLCDLQFGEIGGVFDDLEAAGAMVKLEDFLPSAGSHGLCLNDRDATRAELIKRFSNYLIDVNWDKAIVRDQNHNPYLFYFDDPLDCAQLLRTLCSEDTWNECLQTAINQGNAVRSELCAISLLQKETLPNQV